MITPTEADLIELENTLVYWIANSENNSEQRYRVNQTLKKLIAIARAQAPPIPPMPPYTRSADRREHRKLKRPAKLEVFTRTHPKLEGSTS